MAIEFPHNAVAEVVSAEFDKLRLELIEAYRRKGMKASGAFERELEEQVTERPDGVTGKLLGLAYAEQLEFGRGPTTGSGAGGESLKERIEQWVQDKGLAARVESQTELNSLVYLITRKIHREGWNRKDYGGVELLSEVITPERVALIVKRCGNELVQHLSSEIPKLFKNI